MLLLDIRFRLQWLFSIALCICCFANCKKLVEVPPPISAVNSLTVYDNDALAISTVTGLYATLSTRSASGSSGISFLCALSADEFTLYSGISASATSAYYYRNQLSGNPTIGSDFWIFYKDIYVCNSAIEGLTASTTLTPAVKQQLLGEVRFLRSFYYFYLVNFFGDVPLVISSNYRVNVTMARTSKTQVWQQIIADLKEAQGLLSANYLNATLTKTTTERLRPTLWTATALLARAYLYTGDYANAEAQATTVINNTSLYGLIALTNPTTPVTQNDVFQKNGKEAIWQIQPTVAGHNTEDAFLFLLPSTGPGTSFPVYLSNNLLGSFEAGDQRRYSRNWIDSVKVGTALYYFPYKYRANTFTAVNGVYPAATEYLMVLRLSEQYLIRAEARAQQNNITGAQSDLNTIRQRAGLAATTASTQAALLTAILHEKQVELFTEWGHRWLDLKRTGTVDNVMGNITPGKANGAPWDTRQQLYPIPQNEILYDPNLVQNPGYQ